MTYGLILVVDKILKDGASNYTMRRFYDVAKEEFEKLEKLREVCIITMSVDLTYLPCCCHGNAASFNKTVNDSTRHLVVNKLLFSSFIGLLIY